MLGIPVILQFRRLRLVQGQPGLHGKTMSQKERKRKKKEEKFIKITTYFINET